MTTLIHAPRRPKRSELPAGLAERIVGRLSSREIVALDPASSFHWFEHDYPTPVARWNHHPEYELHLIRHGSGHALVGDHVGSFARGHLALIGPNLPHDWISDLPAGSSIAGRDVVLQFDAERLRRGAAAFPELAELEPLLAAARRGIEFTGETARAGAALLEEVGRTRGLVRLAVLIGLMRTLADAPAAEQRTLASAVFAAPVDDPFEPAMCYIMANIDGQVRMAEAARRARMSESAFSRSFHRMAGQPFVQFVRMLRVAQACRLLRHSRMPISSICFEVGFGNLSNFNRQFRAEMGTSPSDYRGASLYANAHPALRNS